MLNVKKVILVFLRTIFYGIEIKWQLFSILPTIMNLISYAI